MIDPRIPLDKQKLLQMFTSLPELNQISILAGIAIGIVAAEQEQKPQPAAAQ